jgi:predicted N-acetyltransferase YhbS
MSLEVRPLAAGDLDRADRILRDAFTAVNGVDLLADTALLTSRFRAAHSTVLAAYDSGSPVGSIVATRWGDIGLLGPLSVVPRLWGRGIGSSLVGAAVAVLDGAGVVHQGLFTFPHSPRHLAFYQRFGFWPRFLTAIMSGAVTGSEARSGRRLSIEAVHRDRLVAGCAGLTAAIRPGLDLRGEIDAVLDQRIGDVLLVGGDPPDGFAVCHAGAGSEAGSGIAYVKFGAVRPGPGAAATFAALVEACRGYAAQIGARRLVLGVNTARHQAYRRLVGAGLRLDVTGVSMHRPDAPGYDTPAAFVLDDWR